MENILKGKKVLITAGPTREYLDPVRFITNESSGKMGYAIAETLYNLGADVILISGPVYIKPAIPIENVIQVITAREMLEACKKYFRDADIVIFSAAVADYRPKFHSESKIKKAEQVSLVEFIKNDDIAFEFGKIKTEKQVSIGFALETNDILENAANKLKVKGFDAVVINSPKKNEGFGFDTNKVSILKKDGTIKHYPLKNKQEVAVDIVNELEELVALKTYSAKGITQNLES
jgi:phosphopantothenoylcysteine decarboxylase/phosphopantothenate--cysteine ligase